MPELRKEPVLDTWVIIAKERSRIPTIWEKPTSEGHSGLCPFCPGNEHLLPHEILTIYKNEHKEWLLKVIPNKYPLLMVECKTQKMSEGIYDKMDGFGANEVIIETPEHNTPFHQIPDEHMELIFKIYRARINDLKRDIRLKHITIFKNNGKLAGTNILHSHSQLVATPIIPAKIKTELEGAKKYYDYREKCIYCDIIWQETVSEVRVITEDTDFLMFCPYASRFPFEIWIIPKHHESNFENIPETQIKSLSKIVKDAIRRLNTILNVPHYNYFIHTSTLTNPGLLYYHWHIEITPRLTQTTGFELGSDFYINPIPPETAAASLRSA